MTEITIPPEAVEKAAREIAPHPWSMYTDAARDHFRHKALAAIRAALAAWPGMEQDRRVRVRNDGTLGLDLSPRIILPLTENTDAEG